MAGRVFRALTGAAGTVASFGNSTRIPPRCFGRGTVNTARPFTTGFGVRVAQGSNEMAADIKPALVRQYLDTVQLSAYDTNRQTLRTVRETFANHGHDTGGVEVQIASLTERVRYMTTHLQTHHKDNASRRGLVAMLERRKKLLKYLRRTDGDSYGETLYRLGLKDRSFVEDKYPTMSKKK